MEDIFCSVDNKHCASARRSDGVNCQHLTVPPLQCHAEGCAHHRLGGHWVKRCRHHYWEAAAEVQRWSQLPCVAPEVLFPRLAWRWIGRFLAQQIFWSRAQTWVWERLLCSLLEHACFGPSRLWRFRRRGAPLALGTGRHFNPGANNDPYSWGHPASGVYHQTVWRGPRSPAKDSCGKTKHWQAGHSTPGSAEQMSSSSLASARN